MTSSLAGQSVLVTGAGSGIGAAIAASLAAAGCRLVLMDRRPEPVANAAAAMRDDGGDAIDIAGDVRAYDAMERAVGAAIARFGRLDILVACAGIAESGPIAEADPELYRNVVLTNVVGVMNGIRAALPAMLAQGSGHIVVIASVSGRVTYTGESAYVASKHAVVAFVECLRQEVAQSGIRVSLIEPGVVETPLIHVYPDTLDLLPGVTPLDPADVAAAVRYVLEQPPNVNVAEVVLRPTGQVL
ncbi:MAG TPA: SDR family oxidoreductase [Thermomicrobiales bacterium]|nr:SDR family oxidoreductase [Thermomicrobiales bacterium]